ncbi:hypothetical protein HUB98_18135 [Paenibacillus barcinonensis]|uniref:Uncharacterized protein n=1 Tax=Paenibacillus barcinonensis TaxID=198119 RepID=A0A2V4VQG5_PAEBA|nr:hypothetical protein [Paenibacillus barcinonensis]PYE44558.1 hypothetical protein DFQ00_12176 [Paenibacillus barcinonensis]QKS58014.1 hypothetical protein HUB98_18135 [Paenibacillus barcinonensis]
MAANWWLALIIMVVVNAITAWSLWTGERISPRATTWFFVVANVIGAGLAISQFFWMDFS